MDNWAVLKKIEKLVDTLPWQSVFLKITTQNQDYELNKTKQTVIKGFCDPKEGV